MFYPGSAFAYGPLEPFFKQTWKPNKVVKVWFMNNSQARRCTKINQRCA